MTPDLFTIGYDQAFNGLGKGPYNKYSGEYESGYQQGLIDRGYYEAHIEDSVDHFIEEEL